jgi:hypothetical protein
MERRAVGEASGTAKRNVCILLQLQCRFRPGVSLEATASTMNLQPNYHEYLIQQRFSAELVKRLEAGDSHAQAYITQR